MKETPQEYIQRILGFTSGGESPVKIQATTAKKAREVNQGSAGRKVEETPRAG